MAAIDEQDFHDEQNVHDRETQEDSVHECAKGQVRTRNVTIAARYFQRRLQEMCHQVRYQVH